ncbi:serine/threonine phosphatase [Chamaesiphon sp. GL140_3_metabinner_50]|uniref:serine/threonine phosphatase n=1 Tax=Chamaesiphon sp. GL140_3_metabinner_50 TaxID=2970812 RepID=UPI0025DF067D|nr:serine/threonine phosphatase [Chamaesiphon sp. GL140_3_metabinner_50]
MSSTNMISCPYCQLTNPQHNNFCQGCGKSLKHYVCRNCGQNVDFDAESCPQCQTSSGTYWWAIIEPTGETATQQVGVESADSSELGDKLAQIEPIFAEVNASDSNLSLDDLSLWDGAGDILESLVQPDKLVAAPPSDELEPSPWDLSEPDLTADKFESRFPSIPTQTRVEPTVDPVINSEPLVATTYLDPQCNYRLLDPVALQLLKPGDSSQVRVIDRQPFCNTLLEILMEQEPVTLDSPIDDAESEPDSTTAAKPIAAYRQWQFWNTHGIPKVAQAYIALQVSLPGTVPTIRDSWSHDGKAVTIVEDRSNWTQLAASWNDPQIPSSQTIYWLDSTLKLWVALEPWQMRQSLLETANLLLDEDARICFQRLHPEPVDRQLQLADLARMWKQLFDRFPVNEVESHRPASSAIANLLQSIQSGEIERIEEVRSRLQQIAYELEPKQLSAPLQSPVSADLSTPQEAPTISLAQNLIDLEDAAATHTGKKRDHNEDCYGMVSRIDRQNSPKGNSINARGVYILCDGMGGHDGGEIASAMTVDILRDYFATRWDGDTLPDEQTIREGIVAANEAVFEINQKKSAHGSGRMGTTLVLVLVQDRNIAVAHVGDSRCYGITPTQGLIQLTLDHEVGQQQILRGVDPDIAYGRPDSYQLTQAIGPRDRNYIAPDIRFFELQENTLIVLASDGLTDNQLLENYWLTNVAPLLSPNANLQDGVDRLIDFANEYNGHDNITALVVRAKLG